MSFSDCFRQHNPRKGTETTTTQIPSYILTRFRQHNPRKGTETRSGFIPKDLVQGRFRQHNPRKGTETRKHCLLEPTKSGFRQHNPRKGTETLKTGCFFYEDCTVSANIIPARGLKQAIIVVRNLDSIVSANIIPARGLKQLVFAPWR